MSETKTIGTMTERQRCLLSALLGCGAVAAPADRPLAAVS
jgi:hypothetical protein